MGNIHSLSAHIKRELEHITARIFLEPPPCRLRQRLLCAREYTLSDILAGYLSIYIWPARGYCNMTV